MSAVFGIDSSTSGHLAWCKCGWRSLLEPDYPTAHEALVAHRLHAHNESRGRVEHVLKEAQ